MISAVQQRRQGLINEEAQSRVQQTLGQGEGDIEHQQAVKQSILRGHMGHTAQNRLVHPHNGVQREDLRIIEGFLMDMKRTRMWGMPK